MDETRRAETASCNQEGITEKINRAFERWQAEPVTDERLKEIYRDIENIIREAGNDNQ